MQQTPILLPPNFAGGYFPHGSFPSEGMIMMIPAQPAPREPPKNWNQPCAKGVGIATIAVAVLAFIVNIGWFSITDSLASVGVGFWAGIPMATSGILLTIAGFRPKRGVIISVLVMSIIASLMAIGFLAVGASQMYYDPYYYDSSYSSYSFYTTTTTSETPSIGMGTFFVLVGLASFGLLLTASILSCYSVCSDCGRKVSPYPTFAYLPQGLASNPNGSMMQTMYPPSSMGMQGMQPPVMSYGFAPQGMMPQPPPSYSAAREAPKPTTEMHS